MKRIPIITIAFTALILFAAALGLNGIAAANAQAEHLQIMKTRLPGSESFTVEPYSGEDSNIRSVHKGQSGFVIETVTRGYAGEITMLIGVSNQAQVTGLVVREMSETPGLGANVLNDHGFLGQFLGSSGDTEVEVNVDAITGATVTSRAVARSVNSAVAYVTGADASSGATSWGG